MYKQNEPRHLKEYRREMRDITRSILDLILARQNIALRIAYAKQVSGASIENHAVEQKLSKEMAEYAKDIGLEGDITPRIVGELMEYSKIAQRKNIYLPLLKTQIHSFKIKTVSIFGAGRMGGWFAKYFIEAGAKVLVFDENASLARKKARELGCVFTRSFDLAANSDLVVAAIPIKATPRLVLALASYAKTAPLHTMRILEISSVKSEIGKLLKTSLPKNIVVYSIHPLFGPVANPFAVNSLIHIGPDVAFVRGLFPHYRIFKMNIREHDELMSLMLTLPHLHALSFADLIAKNRISADIHSPSFDHLLELSKKVLGESKRVYYEIQATNPYTKKILGETLRSVQKLQRLLKDKSAFEKFFEETGRALR